MNNQLLTYAMAAIPSEESRCTWKLGLCVRNARAASRNSWQFSENDAQRREYLRLSRESMLNARYWKKELAKVSQS